MQGLPSDNIHGCTPEVSCRKFCCGLTSFAMQTVEIEIHLTSISELCAQNRPTDTTDPEQGKLSKGTKVHVHVLKVFLFLFVFIATKE